MLYRVARETGRTAITPISNTESLSLALEDIGVRNSDVLLSDAVLFVEGPGDRDALRAWSDTLDSSMAERNITLLPMHGGEYADRTAPVRSELLEGISQKSPVPHLFVLDRDQRRPSDVQRLEERLVNRIHVLERRELENYLLVPRALLAALRSKCGTDTNVLQRVDETPVEDVEQLIQGTADSLYNTVLLKRVRAELGNLRGGLLTREAVTRLITEGDVQTLPQTVYEAVRAELESYLNEEHIKQVVEEQKEMLDTEWSNPEQRRNIAPGEEIIDAVFQRFGVRYKKPRDTVRIAEEMQPEEIAPEIHDLVRRAVGLNIRE